MPAMDLSFPDFTLSRDDHAFWLARNEVIYYWVLASTAVWVLMHLVVVSVHRPKCFDWISAKDQATWINDVLAWIHALYAIVAGIYFFWSGEHVRVIGGAFGVSDMYDMLSTVGLGYFLYDVLFMFWNWKHYLGQIFTMGIHHVLFVYGFFFARWYPCALSPILFHGFQMTEVSTLFLHKNWMMQKAKVDDAYVVKNGVLLLVFFGVRCLLTYVLWAYAMHFTYTYPLYSYSLPYGMDIHMYGYYAVNVVGPCFMVFLNTKWYLLLISKAMSHLKKDKDTKKA